MRTYHLLSSPFLHRAGGLTAGKPKTSKAGMPIAGTGASAARWAAMSTASVAEQAATRAGAKLRQQKARAKKAAAKAGSSAAPSSEDD